MPEEAMIRAALAGLLALTCAAPLVPARAEPPDPALDLRLGTIVQFPAPTPVCVSKQKLAEFALVSFEQDYKAMHALTQPGAGCSYVAAGSKGKIMTMTFIAGAGSSVALEVEGPDADHVDGVWALAFEAEPAPATAPEAAPKRQPQPAPKRSAKSRGADRAGG